MSRLCRRLNNERAIPVRAQDLRDRRRMTVPAVMENRKIYRNFSMLRDITPFKRKNKSLTVYGDYDTFSHVIITVPAI
jgi:hypothetical protein